MKLNLKNILFFALLALSISSCASVNYVHEVSPNYSAMKPAVIAVMPVMNETVDVDAPKPFIAPIRHALSRRGYALANQELVDKKLEDEGMHIAAQVRTIPDKKLGEMLGAQALLFTTVTSWETVYIGVYASITVGARFELVDANTSEVLWKLEDEAKDISIAVDKKTAEVTAAFAMLQSYEPYVKILVERSFLKLPDR